MCDWRRVYFYGLPLQALFLLIITIMSYVLFDKKS